MAISIEEFARSTTANRLVAPERPPVHGVMILENQPQPAEWLFYADRNMDTQIAPSVGEFIIFPYGELLRRFSVKYDGTNRKGGVFNDGHFAILDFVRHLFRPIQNLSAARTAALESDGPFPLIDRTVSIDISMFLDLIFIYSKCIADVIAMTLPVLFTENPNHTFRDMATRAQRHPRSRLGNCFQGADLRWFDILARHEQGNWGIRTACASRGSSKPRHGNSASGEVQPVAVHQSQIAQFTLPCF